MEEALEAITLVEIRQKLEELDAGMTEKFITDIDREKMTYEYNEWEALIDRVLHGEIITERPS